MGWWNQIGLFATGYAPFLAVDIVLDDIYAATGIGFICLGCTLWICSWYEESAESRRVGRQTKEVQA